MIGRLRTVVVDTKDPTSLAEFYANLIGGRVHVDTPDWVVLTTPAGTRLAFQRSPEHEAPTFPDRKGSQQFHLDIQVDDIDVADRDVSALGAVRLQGVGNEGGDEAFRVYRDPAGHTFCLVWGVPPVTA